MALLPLADFKDVTDSFVGQTVGFVPLPGSRGDRLIDAGAGQLLESCGIEHYRIDRRLLTPDLVRLGIDRLAVSGGGNMGVTYIDPWRVRQLALATGLPVTVLPQSFTDSGEDITAYERVFARESVSLALDRRLRPGPDLALAFTPRHELPGQPVFDTALFLRKDWESAQADRSRSLCDPVKLCRGLAEFLTLAAMFRVVITDRLHFAIAALIAGRSVFLLPNAYHKNRAMYDTWLAALGCGWLDSLSELPRQQQCEVRVESVRWALRSLVREDADTAYQIPGL